MMSNFVVRTLDNLMLIKLFDAFKAERVAARQRNRLLIVVIVRLETDATFKYGFDGLRHYNSDLKFIVIIS